MSKSIEITTAHNIVVYFQLATITERILAILIDLGIVFLSLAIISGIGEGLGLELIIEIIAFFMLTFYHLTFEILNRGQSPGKKLVGIRVVNLKGIPPNPSEAFQRWVFRLIDIALSLGSVAGIFITSSPKNQRLGDIISGCAVIKLKKESDVSLERIQRIQERTREILYPKVISFTEEDMLLLKETLLRYNKFKNSSTRHAVRTLSNRIAKELKMTEDRVDHKLFLEDILKDYVSLTR